MDVMKFLKERKRMCKSFTNCASCPANNSDCTGTKDSSDDVYQKLITAVDKWSREHPRKTRQSIFLEQYPEAQLTMDGELTICPIAVSAAYRNENGGCVVLNKKCADCRREFWTQEVK